MPSIRFIPILSLLVIVSFTTLSYGDFAFAQTEDQANNTKTTPELERMTFRVNFSGDDCTISEKFDVIPLSECEMIKGIPHMTISVLPGHVSELMFKMDSEIHQAKEGSNLKIDTTTLLKQVEYLIQKNRMISERASGNDVADINPKIVKTIIHVDTKNCVFPEKLGLNKTEFDCKQSKMVVHVPSSSITDLIDLDFVKRINIWMDISSMSFTLPSEVGNEVLPVTIPSEKDNEVLPVTIPSEKDNVIGLYYIVLILIVVICLTVFVYLQYRKKEKIEV